MDFNSMFQHASKIKHDQMSQYRKKFDSWPAHYQHTLYAREEIKGFRVLPFVERLGAACALKDEANNLFRQKQFSAAQLKYEEAAGIFRYCECVDESWRKEGINDLKNSEHFYRGETKEEQSGVAKMLLACYNNMAACQFNLQDFLACIQCASSALLIDRTNSKALYRRGVARMTSKQSGVTELELAMKDLRLAVQNDPTNATIVREFSRLKKQLTEQKKKDKKNFSGMFKRGSPVYEDKPDITPFQSTAEKRPRTEDEKAALINKQIKETEIMATHLRQQGKIVQAEKLEQSLQKARDTLGSFYHRYLCGNSHIFTAYNPLAAPRVQELDFLNPTPAMLEDAKKNGVDLNDPEVRRYLQTLQERKLRGHDLEELREEETHDTENIGQENTSPINMKLVFFIALVAMFLRFASSPLPSQLWKMVTKTATSDQNSLLGDNYAQDETGYWEDEF